MKVLIVHNRYLQRGGEDAVYEDQLRYLDQCPGIEVMGYETTNKMIYEYKRAGLVGHVIKSLTGLGQDKALVKVIDSFGPDLIHFHNVYAVITPSIYHYVKRKGIRTVQTLHNYRFMCINGKLVREGQICTECVEQQRYWLPFRRMCYREDRGLSFWFLMMMGLRRQVNHFKYIDSFIALNPFMEAMMVKAGYDASRITIISNGLVDRMSGALGDAEAIVADRNYYLYMGRLEEEKGIVDILDAFTHELSGCRLVVAGTGGLEDYVKKVAEEHDHIDYVGFVSGDWKDDLIGKAKAVLIMPSWYENLPTSVIEAYMMGVPVIGKDIGGVTYMIDHDINGYLVDRNNDLTACVRRMEENEAYGAMAEAARRTYLNRYDSQVVREQMLALYNAKEIENERNLQRD